MKCHDASARDRGYSVNERFTYVRSHKSSAHPQAAYAHELDANERGGFFAHPIELTPLT